ncbi:MAG: 2-oxo acid dehydrogenase subunit E2 [Flavobacteriaceae bacterium]|jgi:pyruvate dehydrogenase E2 component (dihydrolipoamide acetyltransferase)|nr:2-oxo acid dehydrogenase subunit E2 [Flavobacteriaceae bacterium]
MAEVIKMPRLSDTMTEGKVSKWNLKVGDSVKEGDVLAEIETDKAVQDFDYDGDDGILLYQGVQEGESAPVDSLLAIIGQEGEDISALIGADAAVASATINAEPVEDAVSQESQTSASADIPENVDIIRVPRLSDTMTEGKVSKWNFNVGDQINEGDILAEIETDKAVQDFEYDGNGGTLLYQGVEEGNSAPIESLLAIIGPAGTDISGIIASGGKTKPASVPPTEQQSAKAEIKTDKTDTVESNVTSTGDRVFISPLARKIAKDKGIDPAKIKGSGDNGRITRKDVENFIPSVSATPESSLSTAHAVSTPVLPKVVPGTDTETVNTSMRNAIAKSLSSSFFTAPHYNLVFEINMDRAIEDRKAINSLPDTKVSFNDIIIKAVAVALRKHPQVNSSWADTKIIHHGNINIGVAVAVEDGLVVPVIKNTDYLSLTQISASVRDLAGRARDKKLKANEMDGSTFTVSNLGMYGVESFNSIINQPNSCILSVGSINQKPIVKDGQIVVGNVMQISLACDHRVVDGATGSQFLQTLKTYLENPVSLLA